MVKKSAVNEALSPAHLKAIGSVAAAWASLEFMMLIIISKVSEIKPYDVITLAGPSSPTVWMDLILKFTKRSKEQNGKEDDLTPIFNKIKDLQTKRNAIVHAAWHQEAIVGGLLSPDTLIKIPVTIKSPASGMGIPKRGKRAVIEIKYTAAEMMAVAREIPKTEQALLAWLVKPNPVKQTNMLAAALRASPNTHQKSPRQRGLQKPSAE